MAKLYKLTVNDERILVRVVAHERFVKYSELELLKLLGYNNYTHPKNSSWFFDCQPSNIVFKFSLINSSIPIDKIDWNSMNTILFFYFLKKENISKTE